MSDERLTVCASTPVKADEDVSAEDLGAKAFWRGYFDITLPVEPGVHLVQITSWNGVHPRRSNPDGSSVPRLLLGDRKTSSNTIAFEVR